MSDSDRIKELEARVAKLEECIANPLQVIRYEGKINTPLTGFPFTDPWATLTVPVPTCCYCGADLSSYDGGKPFTFVYKNPPHLKGMDQEMTACNDGCAKLYRQFRGR